ncbi:MAG: Leucine rich repeat variant [Candidatus Gottesmanbacteria bacterium GW2011_GWB1_49_7]|uniref:Leucine rich repeat variant n=1 Tax=Candidatus Gottesmanbacteria bacterium GW2011_GWB1_49_7 TaxID=1618448 RepID=A0A0G1YE45_9BACT|nr:MAG: Leucine rich repeat variant [Candidatus Gottesmanbacteria bacterium GW2011_GWB1_49_7]
MTIREMIEMAQTWIDCEGVLGRTDALDTSMSETDALAAASPAYRSWWVDHRRNMPYEVFVLLASDKNHNIRTAVANRKDLPGDLLTRLANDDSCYVRSAIHHRQTYQRRSPPASKTL